MTDKILTGILILAVLAVLLLGFSFIRTLNRMQKLLRDYEEKDVYKRQLMTTGKRESSLLAKWMSLEILAFFAVMGAVIFYGAGNRLILGDMEIPFSVFLKAGVFLWLGSLPLYLEHLFLNLCFSKAVSLAVSIGQLLISALFLTGLGQGKWQYVPSSWSSRGASLLSLIHISGRKRTVFAGTCP